MTAGLRVINNAGDIQVDELYKNLHLATKVNISVGAGDTYLGTFINPVCVVYSTSARTFGSVFRREFANPTHWWFYGAPPSGQALTVYVFDTHTPTDPGFGLKVFSAPGVVACNILAKPLVVVDEIIAPKNATTTRTYVSGRQYAVLPQTAIQGFTFQSITAGITIVGNNASTTPASMRFLVVDVTGY
jgi:hypothetical protein